LKLNLVCFAFNILFFFLNHYFFALNIQKYSSFIIIQRSMLWLYVWL